MTNDIDIKNNNQIIFCPYCKAPITVDELGEYVNAHPDIKKKAIEEELRLGGNVYDRNYLLQNVVFCPNCRKVSHFKVWASTKNTSKK